MNCTSVDMAALIRNILFFKHVGAVCCKMYTLWGQEVIGQYKKTLLNLEQAKKMFPYGVETTATSAPSSH